MKIAILNDTHAGTRNGSDIFIDYADQFYTKVFFPYCKKHEITQIIHLGDYFDHRKYVSYKVLRRNREVFLDGLKSHGMTMDIIPGNHDVAYKNTNGLCSLVEVLSQYRDRVNIHMKPTVKDFDGLPIGFLPWIAPDNEAESLEFISKAPTSVIMSHLELTGFEMMRGVEVTSHGMDPTLFSRYEMVLSGHYHTKSARGNIHYLGTQFELSWSDAGDPKHFHVLDTSTRELEAIRNPIVLFKRVRYSDDSIPEITLADHGKSFIKIVVVKKKDPFLFDKFLERVYAVSPFEVKIVESFEEFAGSSVSISEDDVAVDTQSLLHAYVDSLDTSLNGDVLKKMLQELYVEAQEADSI